MKAYRYKRLVAVIIVVLLSLGACISCSKPDEGVVPDTSTPPDAASTESIEISPADTGSPLAPTFPPEQTPEATEAPVATDEPAQSIPPSETAQPGETALPTASPIPDRTEATFTTPETTSLPTDTPVTPTAAPTEVPPPDPVTDLTYIEPDRQYYCDMDFDGEPEKIEIITKTRDVNKQFTVKVTVGSTGSVLIDTFFTEKYVCGFLNNFNTGDNRVELVISTCTGERDSVTHCYRLNPESSGLLIDETEGWVDSVQGNTLTISRYEDIMGTWECCCTHSFEHNDFALVPTDEDWTVKFEAGRWCTVSIEMLAGLYVSGPENYIGFLEPGEKLYPTATDLKERVDFMTDTNSSGYLNVTFDENGTAMINDKPMERYFSDLTFIH